VELIWKVYTASVAQEIPTGQGNRVRAEVVGLYEHPCATANDLLYFFEQCFENRSTGSTRLNDTSSRSHALFTINVHRVVRSISAGFSLEFNRRSL
jgi:hypothetical protein